VCALLLSLVQAIHGQAGALDYPQWRGRNGDGEASAFTPPRVWPEALTRRWRTGVGEGYATPLVVGEAVYVFTRREGNEIMVALDAATGAETWRSGYPAPYTPGNPAAAHGSGPKATPLFHEGKLFALGVSGIVTAFDAATGRQLWQIPAPAEHPFFSAASSPVGAKGIVILHPGNYGPLTAFDADTGAARWTAGTSGFFMSPLRAELGGVAQVVSVTQAGVIGVSIADGRLLWQYPWTGGGTGGSMPVLYGDTVIVSATNVGTVAFRPVHRDGSWTTETMWETTDVAMYLSNPVVVGDALFGLSQRSSGQFFALDARTGKVLWLGQPREAANTAVVKAGGLLLLLNDDAELIVARASGAGFEPLKRYTVADGATWAQPVVSGNRIFIRDAGSVSLWTVE
jgi:outer membrane protein assembly factor BamB